MCCELPDCPCLCGGVIKDFACDCRPLAGRRYRHPLCVLPINHSGECRTKAGTATEWADHPGETVDGIREMAVIDRYYARDDMSDAGLSA